MAIAVIGKKVLGLRTIVLGCLLAGPIALLVPSRPANGDEPSAPRTVRSPRRDCHAITFSYSEVRTTTRCPSGPSRTGSSDARRSSRGCRP